MQVPSPKVKIIADSSCDIPALPHVAFASVPLTISTAERSFTDDWNLNVDEMLNYLAGYSGRSHTACPNVDDWLRCFEGAEEIYVVVLSSNISGAYNTAMSASKVYLKEHPGAKLRIFDTRSAGPQVRLLVEKLEEYVLAGKSFEEVCALADAYYRKSRVFFALESFHNFAENGRVSKTVAKLAGLLGIRIMATASLEGQIDIVKKCRGAQGTRKEFLNCMKENEYAGGKCFISHCKNPEFAEEIAQSIRKAYPGAQVVISETRGLCSYYAEDGGILMSFECEKPYQ